MSRCYLLFSLPLVPMLFVATPAAAQQATTPGTASAPFPTFENISLQWEIAGDDNLDGKVTVRFRPQGDDEFREALPLFRVPPGSRAGHSWQNKHAGSIFGLEPGQSYEVELTLSDPDGGDTSEILEVSTRGLPADPSNPRLVDVTPQNLAAALAAAQPGDILQLAAGNYDAFSLENDGESERPLILRSQQPEAAVVTGEITLSGRRHVHVDGLTINGRIRMNDAEAIAITNCRIRTDEHGIVSYGNGVTNSVISNNTITGPTVWSDSALGVDGDNLGEGVVITGPGNVIAYNRVSGFRDCLSLLESDEAVNQTSVDIYGNDLSECADDGIEADYAAGNVRVYRNSIREAFMGISSQPGLGGPTYFLRNVMYNVIYEAFKLHNESAGDVLLHNTVVKSGDAFAVYTDDTISYAYTRNNVFIGGPGGEYGGYDSGDGAVIDLRSADATCSFDYDAFGSTGPLGFQGRVGDVGFEDLAGLQQDTSEAHAFEVDLADFADNVEVPSDPFAPAATPDLRPDAGGALIDNGLILPNINDDYEGGGPELGAYESGRELPVYGPAGNLEPTSPPVGGAGGATETDATGGTLGTATSTGIGGSTSAVGGTTETTGSGVTGTSSGATSASGDTEGGMQPSGSATGGESSGGNDDSGGCGCLVGAGASRSRSGSLLGAFLVVAVVWRRRRPLARRSG